MAIDYDVVVAGGSIAGLTFAAEASMRGASVLVAEEHTEIGEPEKCDGLVSLRGLRKYGYPPEEGVVQNRIASAVVHSPSGKEAAVSAASLDVVVLDRSRFDKQAAKTATDKGAEVRNGVRVLSALERDGAMHVDVGGAHLVAKYFVDATGPSSSPRRGILPAAKYELEGDWIRDGVVEVFMDAELYPGFFAWVIPYGRHLAKVGAAGHGINPFRALDGFLSDRPSTVLRKVSAPIYVGGPKARFVEGRRIFVGESAGQVKPTTAGGIMTSIAGAAIAAKWTAASLERNQASLLMNYQAEWELAFLKEMKTMLRLRGVLEKLSNADLEAVIATVASPKLLQKISTTDFDFHGTAILGALGVPGLLKLAKVVASAEVRSLLAEA
ncbi:MAG TPA: NAD(P)/FAD-dependent oxidoreductase [Nitrososphaerales archaeon]|nr:NAD(P)/FAD-dependent oxidoreductase [Nitrososphaerales archaeon]